MPTCHTRQCVTTRATVARQAMKVGADRGYPCQVSPGAEPHQVGSPTIQIEHGLLGDDVGQGRVGLGLPGDAAHLQGPEPATQT